MSDPVDPIKALVSFLSADTAIDERTGGLVFAGEVPPNQKDSMPQSLIVVSPAGGALMTGRGYESYSDFRVNVVCYGETLREAWMLHIETKLALKNMRRVVYDGCLLHWARESGSSALARDPDSTWPTALGAFQVLAAEIAAT